MKKNGFTTVELVISFSLAMAIAVFLFQIVLVLKDIYTEDGLKTQLLSKQALISNQINKKIKEKGLSSVTKCGDYCILFTYSDSSSEQLSVDKTKNAFSFGNYMTDFPSGTRIGNVTVMVYNSPVIIEGHNNSIMVLEIPILNNNVKGNFNVTVVYQYISDNANITNISLN